LKTYSEEEINEYYDDEPEPVFCPLCEERGYRVELGPRILMPGEPRPDDYEYFLECPTCYQVIDIHAALIEATIKDAVETIESPFEQGKFILESIPKRGSAAGRKLSARKRRNKIKLDSDPEIDALLRAYGDDRVKVIQ
jgi:hypothetical protein